VGSRPSVYRLLAIKTLRRRETHDFRLGESSASRRSTAILPFGEDMFKIHNTFLSPKLEGYVRVRSFFWEAANEVVLVAKGGRTSPEKIDEIR